MILNICAQTHAGRIRENNEDAVDFDSSSGVCVLADGMGGYNAGEVASAMAASTTLSELTSWLSSVGDRTSVRDIKRAMRDSVDHANDNIYQASILNDKYAGMGTTLVVGVFWGSRLLLGHIGDSRCYRLRANELTRLTRDHSLLQEQLDAGLLTAAQAASSPNRNLVTRALGVEDAVMLELHEHPVLVGDLYLMCSDGLTDMVPDEAIAKITRNSSTLEQLSESLIFWANEAGGRDNITVLLVRVNEMTGQRGLVSKLLGR